jgi:hypothetical protein
VLGKNFASSISTAIAAISIIAASSVTVFAQGAYQRPTTLIVPVALPNQVASALGDVCKNSFAGSRWADRTFAEGIAKAIDGDTALMTAKSAGALLERLNQAGIPREYILKQFLAENDFDWKLTRLQERSLYAVTVAEAKTRVNQMSGAAPEDFRTVPASYIVAVHSPAVDQKAGKDMLGNATIAVSAKLHASVFKIGYRTQGDIPAALSDFFCSQCPDKAERRSKFSQYTVPFEHVSSFTVNASASVAEGDGNAKAIAALGESVLDELMTEMASEIAEFAVQEKVIAVDPVALRIGKKEGLRKGARFFHYTVEQESDGNQVQKRRAVLVAKTIADNRTNAIDASGAVGANVAAVDSSTFRQVYPGKVERGDVVMEKPSTISWHAGAGAFDSDAMIYAEVRTEELAGQLGLPPSLRLIAGFKTFQYAGIYRFNFIGAGAGYELHPLRGRVRLMPMVAYNFANSISSLDGDEEVEADPGIELGLDFGIRVHPTIELTGTLRQIAYTDPLASALITQGTMIGVGLRLQRGRWGF